MEGLRCPNLAMETSELSHLVTSISQNSEKLRENNTVSIVITLKTFSKRSKKNADRVANAVYTFVFFFNLFRMTVMLPPVA